MHARQPLVSVAGDVWAAGFKAHFVAFWLFAQSHQLRVSRLDATQHAAVHGLNKATQLAAQLDVDTALAVQRAVLRNPAAGILTLGEVAAELGIDGIPLVASGVGARSAIEGVKLLGDAGPEAASKLLSYARAAWVNEEVLVVNLGSRTRALQLVALRKRLRLPEDTPETQLPMHATHVCCCAECRRVANAYATSTSSVAFNELGISSCQIATDCDPGEVRLHCAKRSSAALRTAVAFETEMKRRCVEMETVERTQLTGLTTPRRATGVESGIAARVRRDAKNALEQRVSAVACGEHPMFTIPVVGCAVRVYKQWFALCSYCAALTRVQPGVHVYGADVCCMRCDHGMLGVDNLTAVPLAAQSSGKVCRYCGCGNLLRPRTLPCAPSIACYPLQLYTHNPSPVCTVERMNTTGVRWKELKAPLDIAGPNAVLPPPLRRVWYCPAHYKPWLLNSHRVMETRVILAHIAHNAKPVFGASPAEQEAEKKERAKQPKKKQRRLPKHK